MPDTTVRGIRFVPITAEIAREMPCYILGALISKAFLLEREQMMSVRIHLACLPFRPVQDRIALHKGDQNKIV